MVHNTDLKYEKGQGKEESKNRWIVAAKINIPEINHSQEEQGVEK